MSGKVLLDTTIVIRLLNDNQRVQSRIVHFEIYLPCIVVGELAFGANKSGRVQHNLDRLEEFVAKSTLLDVGLETARIYGQIKQSLLAKGRPIPDNDLWIASLAIQHQLPVVTYDAHFAEITGLIVETW